MGQRIPVSKINAVDWLIHFAVNFPRSERRACRYLPVDKIQSAERTEARSLKYLLNGAATLYLSFIVASCRAPVCSAPRRGGGRGEGGGGSPRNACWKWAASLPSHDPVPEQNMSFFHTRFHNWVLRSILILGVTSEGSTRFENSKLFSLEVNILFEHLAVLWFWTSFQEQNLKLILPLITIPDLKP